MVYKIRLLKYTRIYVNIYRFEKKINIPYVKILYKFKKKLKLKNELIVQIKQPKSVRKSKIFRNLKRFQE